MKSKLFLRTVLCRSILFAFIAAFLAFICASRANAQSTGGRIRGTVTDATGGAVAAAKVTITNQANGLQRETETGANGDYILLEVPVGTYEVEVNLTGFKKYLRKSVPLSLNEVLTLDA